MKRGVTLLEVLSVISIFAVLAVLSFPAFIRAKEEGKKTVCVSNLRQMFVSTSLYRSDWGSEAIYGKAEDMGLPPIPQPDHLLSLRQFKCQNAPHPLEPTLGRGYIFYYIDSKLDLLTPSWEKYSQEYGDASMLNADPFHNPADIALTWGSHISRFCQGVNLGGSLVRRRAKGDWQYRAWWHDQPG